MPNKKTVPTYNIIYGKKKNKPKALGRIVAVDFRDKRFAVSKKRTDKKKIYWETGKVLDQGNEGQCVAYAWEQFLVSAPILNDYYKTPEILYKECQKVDEWEGEDYEGTSTRAGAKVLKKEGRIKSYSWAFDADTAANYILTQGPVVFGTDWYSSMYDTDSEGYFSLDLESEPIGGHTYMVCGVNLDLRCPNGDVGAFRIINSWGTGWGKEGFGWLSLDDADWLIKNGGEVATAEETKFMLVGQES